MGDLQHKLAHVCIRLKKLIDEHGTGNNFALSEIDQHWPAMQLARFIKSHLAEIQKDQRFKGLSIRYVPRRGAHAASIAVDDLTMTPAQNAAAQSFVVDLNKLIKL